MKGSYYFRISRAPLKMLPYSINEIYEIVTEGKKTDVKESYHAFRQLYSNYPKPENNRMETIITEDSNSGFQFFASVFEGKNVISTDGNGNILRTIQQFPNNEILAIADGAAFGAMIEKCLSYLNANDCQRITLWLPESFEFLVLQSGLIFSEKLREIFQNPSDYIDCQQYESWEQYFTDLLHTLTKNTAAAYDKNHLSPYYLQERNILKITGTFPEVLKKALHGNTPL